MFIALPVPGEVRASLGGDLEPYRVAFPDVRWLDSATWHVTLVFIGSVPSSASADLARVCDEVAVARSPFAVGIDGGGGRVQRGDGVAWLAIAEGAGRVIDMAGDLQRVIVPKHSGLPEPKRAVSAHLTVARRADERVVSALRDERLGPLRAGWRADRIDLVRSHLGGTGASYERVHGARLRDSMSP